MNPLERNWRDLPISQNALAAEHAWRRKPKAKKRKK